MLHFPWLFPPGSEVLFLRQNLGNTAPLSSRTGSLRPAGRAGANSYFSEAAIPVFKLILSFYGFKPYQEEM
jgi:hypothetical protein